MYPEPTPEERRQIEARLGELACDPARVAEVKEKNMMDPDLQASFRACEACEGLASGPVPFFSVHGPTADVDALAPGEDPEY